MAAAQQNPAEQMTAFWRDWFAQMGAAGAAQQQQQQAAAAAAAGQNAFGQFPGAWPFPWAQTPEAMRQMQTAFLDAMSQQCDQYMRSPQFLEMMKRSMDQALEFRQRVDKLVKDSAQTAFSAASGGAPEDILSSLRQIERRLVERLDELSDRIDQLEGSGKGGAGDGPKKSGAGTAKRG